MWPTFSRTSGSAIEQLDLDRLGSVGQITDHVLQDLYELNVQLRLSLLDLRAQVGHDLVDAAIALVLQLHGDVAGVGLGDCSETHLQPRTPRYAFHLRRVAKHPFHMPQDAIRLRKELPAGMM